MSAALAGSDSSFIKSSESIFVNPAGLAPSSKKHRKIFGKSDFAIHYSMQNNSLMAPYIEDKTSTGTNNKSAYSISLRLGTKKSDWSLGVGYYTPGTLNTDFSSLDYSSIEPNYSGKVSSYSQFLGISEFSAGLGYKLLKWVDIGIAWRYAFYQSTIKETKLIELASKEVGTLANVPNGLYFLQENEFSNLSGTNNTGYLFGLQIGPESKIWGIGVSYRTKMIIRLTGNFSGMITSPGVNQTNTILTLLGYAPDASASSDQILERDFFWETALPSRVAISAHIAPQNFGIFFEYTMTNYSEIQQINVDGQYSLPSSVVGSNYSQNMLTFESIPTLWKNEQSIKVGLKYFITENWALMGGYLMSTAVSNPTYIRLIDPPNGPTKTYSFGTSLNYQSWKLIIAYLMSSSNSEVTIDDANIETPKTFNSTYSTLNPTNGTLTQVGTILMLGLRYTFF